MVVFSHTHWMQLNGILSLSEGFVGLLKLLYLISKSNSCKLIGLFYIYILYAPLFYRVGEVWQTEQDVSLFAGPLEKGQVKNEVLRELRVELSKKHKARELDGFGLYL